MLMPVATAGMPAVRDISGTWMQFMGIPTDGGVSTYNSLSEYAKAPADEAWVYRCVALKAFFAQSVPLRVYVKDGRTRVPAEDTSNAAAQDLQGLLDDVNPVNMNGGDLKAFSTAAMSVWGENYVRKVRGRFGGAPQELWWLRAPDVKANMGRVWIDSYTYKSGASSEDFPARDVIAWRNVNLKDPTRGLSPLSAVRFAISVNRQSDEQAANLLANWSVPPGAWVIPKDADFTSEDRSLVRRALRALRGPRGAGKVPILPQGLTWQTIGLTPADTESVHQRKLSRMQICAALGVPLVLAGDDEKTTVYANMRDAERVFARYMISELDGMADGYNGWLVPDFDPVRPAQRTIVVAFDYSEIEALQAPLEDRKRVALSEIQHGARTGDEYRAEFKTGLPLPNGEGQIVTRLSTLLPIGEGPPAPPADITAPAEELPTDGSDTIRSFGRDLYKHPAIKAWVADPSTPLNTSALLGWPTSTAARSTIEAGIRRRASAAAIADALEGVPA
jgi:HK97 family phage portal protein